ncbi:sacsin N-terminal ATP-binding-like domain-containing protein [Microbispora bryophytorum]|uniref:sacsin N-terminal ATP-binding-like domain-containing protein n=1 Tax=Microbispora bryophytorum TaxID=1460882 RepID=UPI00341133F8
MFDTARLRDTVLAAWTASPARFREDANAEEDFALGGYRDRLVVELAQNAADAALRAGVRGRLRLTLADGVLLAANSGAPLDQTGVEGLCTLRVSGKKDEAGAAGRFGVGFAAVVSVTDTPSVASRAAGSASRAVAGVRWSREETAALVAARPELAAELEGREGHVPLLRLPFSDGSFDVPEGFDTIVRLPLRDQAAEQAVRRMLEEAGPALPLSMPALETVEIEVDGRTRTISAEGWHVVAESGTFGPEQVAELFADRPTEERARPYWEVRWAVPGDSPKGVPGAVPRVVHAPTPSDEPLDLPALLIASFPMTTDRRHVAPGPLTDFLVARAAEAYVRLLGELPATPDLLDLVPGLMGKGALDAAIRREIVKALPDTPLLPTISEGVVPGNQARAVDGTAGFLAKIAGLVPGLLPAGWASRHPALTTLGVRRVDLADVVDMLSGEAVEDKDPAWWRSLYEVLPADDPEAIGAVAVPLADGRLVRGPRGTLVLSQESGAFDPASSLAPLDPASSLAPLDPALLAPLGLRIVHPDAVHPLLLRLGAAEAAPRTVLEDPLTHAAVSESLNNADPEPVAQAVLALVDAAGLTAGEAPWLADLALRGADGELYTAGELLLAEGSLAGLIDPEVPFGVAAPDLVEKFGPHVLAAAGVLDGFAVVNDSDVLLDPAECDHDLDLEDEWLEAVLDLLPDSLDTGLDVPPVVREFTAVRDLEYVADWSDALALLSRPPLRAALRPMRVLAAGETVEVPSYTAWWLSRHPVLGGRKPAELRLATGDPLLFGLYGEAPAGIDEDALKMIGVRSTLAELLGSHGGPEELLDLLADPSLEVDRVQLRSLWIELAAVDPARVSPPEAVRAVLKGTITVADAEDGPVVVEAPDLLALVEDRPLVLAPFDLAEALSEVLDLPLAGEVVTGAVTSAGADKPVPPEVRSLLPGAPATYVEHDELLVDGRPVPWRFFEGVVHATGVDGLARGLAWAAGQWGDRLAVAALLRDPARVPLLLAEADLDPTTSLS